MLSRAQTEGVYAPCPVGVPGTAESLLTRRCLARTSGAERKVSTFRGLLPFLSLSRSFSRSFIVGFLPNTWVCPAMMYKTKSCAKNKTKQRARGREHKGGSTTDWGGRGGGGGGRKRAGGRDRERER